MHETDVNTEDSKKQTARKFKAFSWLPSNARTLDLQVLELTKDITAGVKLCLELIERASLDEDADDAYLADFHKGVLTRFAIASCTTLEEVIEKRFNDIRCKATGGAQ